MGGPQERGQYSGREGLILRETEPSPIRIAFIFPGQGLQFVGMGKSLFDEFPVARNKYEEADDVLGYSISQISFAGPKEELEKTTHIQPAIFVASIAAYEVAREVLSRSSVAVKPDIVAGVSLGELTSLVAAGVVDFSTLLRFIKVRGIVSEEFAGIGGMFSAFDLSRNAVDMVCEETGVEPAIFYPDFTVFAGLSENISLASLMLEKMGKKVRPAGRYPFHSKVMEPAKTRIKKEIESIEFADPDFPLVHGATGELLTSGQQIKNLIPDLFTDHVDVEKGLRAIQSRNPQLVVECGPRQFLGPILKKQHGDLRIVSIHDASSLESLAIASEIS